MRATLNLNRANEIQSLQKYLFLGPRSFPLREADVHGHQNKAFCSNSGHCRCFSEEKMNSCESCYYLIMSRVNEEHIIDEHFLFENWWNIDPWKSFFFANIITPTDLRDRVLTIPRSQRWQIGLSYGRFVYTDAFDFDVGFYPLHGPRSSTNIIRIVCDFVQCAGCGNDAPIDIKTIYPWNRYYAQCGRH